MFILTSFITTFRSCWIRFPPSVLVCSGHSWCFSQEQMDRFIPNREPELESRIPAANWASQRCWKFSKRNGNGAKWVALEKVPKFEWLKKKILWFFPTSPIRMSGFALLSESSGQPEPWPSPCIAGWAMLSWWICGFVKVLTEMDHEAWKKKSSLKNGS